MVELLMSCTAGFWRKQIDHICQHLKAQAQNDAEFRALIGEPKMGRVCFLCLHGFLCLFFSKQVFSLISGKAGDQKKRNTCSYVPNCTLVCFALTCSSAQAEVQSLIYIYICVLMLSLTLQHEIWVHNGAWVKLGFKLWYVCNCHRKKERRNTC